MYRFFIILMASITTTTCWASGCYSTYLEGTRTGYGKVPLYSSMMLVSSSTLLATEGGLSDDQKQTANIGLVFSGFYFYIAGHGYCRVVDKKKYDELAARRKKILDENPQATLPFELRYLSPIPSEEEYKRQIADWKHYQKRLLFIVGGINSALLFENAQASENGGVKIFSYLSIAAIVGMGIFDIDNLWNEENPAWVDVRLLPAKVGTREVPVLYLSYRF